MRNVSVILVGLHLIINKPIDLSFIRHDRSFQGKLLHFEGLEELVESSSKLVQLDDSVTEAGQLPQVSSSIDRRMMR